DPVALGEDEALHLRVPPPGLVSEVDAALQELAHGHYGHVRVLLWSPWLSRRAGGPSPWRPVVGRGDPRHRSGPGRPPPRTDARQVAARAAATSRTRPTGRYASGARNQARTGVWSGVTAAPVSRAYNPSANIGRPMIMNELATSPLANTLPNDTRNSRNAGTSNTTTITASTAISAGRRLWYTDGCGPAARDGFAAASSPVTPIDGAPDTG